MRRSRPLKTALLALAALLLAPAPLLAADIEIKIPKDMALKEFVDLIANATTGTLLYVEADIKDRTVGGPFHLTVPEDRVADTFRFVLGLQDFRIRDFGGLGNFGVILPRTATTAKFRAVHLPYAVSFNRPPAAWRRQEDAAATLTKDSVTALLQTLEDKDASAKTRAVAATLLGYCGPRDEAVVTGLADSLETKDKDLVADACWALGRIGYAARPALPALQKSDHPAAKRAIETIKKAVSPALLNPRLAKDKAPDTFKVKFETTKGDIVVECTRAWSPIGADRFYNLVKIGYFTDIAFFRMAKEFVVQFGIHGDPRVNAAWRNANIRDDPVKQSNKIGTLSYANAGRNTRSVQFFINIDDNNRGRKNLDRMGFSPFAKIVEGMDVVEKLNDEYGEKPDQQRMQYEGNEYLKQFFERLDYIRRATFVK